MGKQKINAVVNGESNSTYIIAEIGVNHNGDINLALKMIDAAYEAGADAVKFQSFKSDKLVSRFAEKAKYQQDHTGTNETQLEMLKKLELSPEDHLIIKEYCAKKDIDFLSTPFDEETAIFLKEIGIHAYKVGSGDLTNIPFLRKIDEFGLPIILSTGMSNLGEIEEALEVINKSSIALLHCTSSYPAPVEDINLRAMVTIQKAFNKVVGYSDHTEGIEIALAAVALGARIIEKHFTLDKNLPGPDHKASLEPHEFKQLVKSIRIVEKSLGDGVKRCMPSEENTKEVARKSLVVSQNLKPGDILTRKNLAIKRPGTGIQPKDYNLLLGKTVKREVKQDQVLTWDDVL
ncbi:MAG: N-acetylneuraminate synthase [Caldibacillus debilis]|uniref:N-acetylneuraminate synthase n=1 Tax=Caldibacillus debilis TaxID=301148 RepID=A0A3E0K3B3_9BACI|nr:N-acetylneuraminate synthase [Caldibacillus debilis]REJ27593.1 MAG: N-acetylneuraminate synthase [Caldibacillus debilis]